MGPKDERRPLSLIDRWEMDDDGAFGIVETEDEEETPGNDE